MSKTKRIVTKPTRKNKLEYEYIMTLRAKGMTYEAIGNSFSPRRYPQSINRKVLNFQRMWGTKKADATNICS